MQGPILAKAVAHGTSFARRDEISITPILTYDSCAPSYSKLLPFLGGHFGPEKNI